jgi:hypothetical protein
VRRCDLRAGSISVLLTCCVAMVAEAEGGVRCHMARHPAKASHALSIGYHCAHRDLVCAGCSGRFRHFPLCELTQGRSQRHPVGRPAQPTDSATHRSSTCPGPTFPFTGLVHLVSAISYKKFWRRCSQSISLTGTQTSSWMRGCTACLTIGSQQTFRGERRPVGGLWGAEGSLPVHVNICCSDYPGCYFYLWPGGHQQCQGVSAGCISGWHRVLCAVCAL